MMQKLVFLSVMFSLAMLISINYATAAPSWLSVDNYDVQVNENTTILSVESLSNIAQFTDEDISAMGDVVGYGWTDDFSDVFITRISAVPQYGPEYQNDWFSHIFTFNRVNETTFCVVDFKQPHPVTTIIINENNLTVEINNSDLPFDATQNIEPFGLVATIDDTDVCPLISGIDVGIIIKII